MSMLMLYIMVVNCLLTLEIALICYVDTKSYCIITSNQKTRNDNKVLLTVTVVVVVQYSLLCLL